MHYRQRLEAVFPTFRSLAGRWYNRIQGHPPSCPPDPQDKNASMLHHVRSFRTKYSSIVPISVFDLAIIRYLISDMWITLKFWSSLCFFFFLVSAWLVGPVYFSPMFDACIMCEHRGEFRIFAWKWTWDGGADYWECLWSSLVDVIRNGNVDHPWQVSMKVIQR